MIITILGYIAMGVGGLVLLIAALLLAAVLMFYLAIGLFYGAWMIVVFLEIGHTWIEDKIWRRRR
jgi:hypothetical protein